MRRIIMLQEEIDSARKEIKTDAYSMSIGELINLYKDKEIDIHPEFQRFYRWKDSQKTKFIESLLLGIPIPPIFVAQTEDGKWDVVDGVQRLSTIFEFCGVLVDQNGQKIPPLKLQKAQYLPSLEDMKFEDENDPEHSFSTSQKLYIKRSKIDISIILRDSDLKAKYELFQRLNTGGTQLSEQEVRNCLIVMIDSSFYDWVKKLSENGSFQHVISLTDRSILEQYDLELVLRFLIFTRISDKELATIKDVGDFITERMIKMIENHEYNEKEDTEKFVKTFELLENALGSNAFRKYRDGKYFGGFLLSAYEVIGIGLGKNISNIKYVEDEVEKKAKTVWRNKTFITYSGSGVRGNSRLPHLIPLGVKIFKQ